MSYFSKLFLTGAVRETPDKVIQAMLAAIGPGPLDTAVEIGAGKGELTAAILKNGVSPVHYHAFEIDLTAINNLRSRFPSISVHQSDAFHFSEQLPEGKIIDLFVSSIPLSFYGKETVRALFRKIKGKMKRRGKVIIIFSAVWLIPLLRQEFPGATIQGFLTLPPYFLCSFINPVG